MLPTRRRPTTPGEILREEFMAPKELTQVALAKRLKISLQRLNAILNGRRAVTADTALLLAKELGTTPELWMNLQSAVDLWDAQQRQGGQRRFRAQAARGARAS
jgi:addiction module HigA family antidote